MADGPRLRLPGVEAADSAALRQSHDEMVAYVRRRIAQYEAILAALMALDVEQRLKPAPADKDWLGIEHVRNV
jgi:hypothetical protein